MPELNFIVKSQIYMVYRNGILDKPFSTRLSAYNYTHSTAIKTKSCLFRSYSQVTRILRKERKFIYTDSLNTIFVIQKTILYK